MIVLPRRVGLVVFALMLAPMLSWPAALSAQDYPTRPVKIIVPFGAGGPADVYSRVLAQHLSEALKQPFVVEDRPGAGSIIGTDAVAKSPPDGYTLLKNKPGELNYASSGAGTPYHMAAELFKAMSGTNLVHVPHKASGEMRNSVIGGHVQMAFDAITTMAPNVKAGQVRALGTSAARRSTVLPDVPTIAEAGVPGYESTIWLGIMAPVGTPKAIVDLLNAEINKAISRPDVKEAWDKQGAVALVMTPAEFDAYLRKDIEKWAQVVKVSGIKAE